MNKRNIGNQAEEMALNYLQSKGLMVIDRNFQTKMGEIDLIMKDQNELVFVEVRMRADASFGDGAATVDARKQRKICLTALAYLQRHKLNEHFCRFDVISIQHKNTQTNHINWIKNAFEHTR